LSVSSYRAEELLPDFKSRYHEFRLFGDQLFNDRRSAIFSPQWLDFDFNEAEHQNDTARRGATFSGE
jgi:hypothetical protein